MSYEDAFRKVEQAEGYIVDLLQRLIAVDTSVPPGENYSELIDIVEPEFHKFGFETTRVTLPEEKVAQMPWPLSGPRVNLVAKQRADRPEASAYAHMDVVPIEGNWTREPFGGEVIDGKLYGRGSSDMKGSIACFLGAMKVLHEMGLEPHYALSCLLCTDEELGVYPGARYLAEEGYFSDHLIWLELGAMEPIVTIGSAGAIRLDIKGIGRSCHSGMNYLGINAVEEMVPIMNELLELKKKAETRLSRLPTFPVPGWTKENIVPEECELTINRRYIVDERYEDVVAEIEEAVQRGRKGSKLEDVELKITHAYPPMECDPDLPAGHKARAAKTAVHGYENFIYGGVSGSTDLGFVIEALKPRQAEVAGFGLARASNLVAHAADEFVYVEDLVLMTKELVHYAAF
jgi:succinyl-diaminopimelate desuccinylase